MYPIGCFSYHDVKRIGIQKCAKLLLVLLLFIAKSAFKGKVVDDIVHDQQSFTVIDYQQLLLPFQRILRIREFLFSYDCDRDRDHDHDAY